MSRLVVLEGCDGTGKTTLGRELALALNWRYVHCPSFNNVRGSGASLARFFAEAMLPVTLGLAPGLIMDRCWLSDPIYGAAYRGGLDRVGIDRRLLERIALRTHPFVVHCHTDWEAVRASFHARREAELLDDEAQLRAVYDAYARPLATELAVVKYDREAFSTMTDAVSSVLSRIPRDRGFHVHSIATTVGYWRAPILLVGEAFGSHQATNSFYQWPFCGFNESGCSRWFARQLDAAGIGERELLWVNADSPDLLRATRAPAVRRVVALGEVASRALTAIGQTNHVVAPHPQYWKRFQAAHPYPAHLLTGED